jgi:UDP-N-acetylmuramoylalanine--D-glutamate ligase|tara:strand:+ start:540 stop:1832 length:1293 start_codon:yes stop_codon:yes gene_type:complete
MFNLNDNIKNKKFLIYGYGKSGRASYNYLKKKNKILIYDDNKKLKKFFISLKKIKLTEFDYIVLSPGIDISKCRLKNYLKKNKKKIITDLDIFYLNNPNNLKITITGTNGKSTTAKLLFKILKDQNKDVKLVGNIGIPVLSKNKIKSSTIFVIEASSYQIDYSQYFKTDYAFILNISPDHLERHKSIQKYTQAKFKLILNQNKNFYAFVENNKYLNRQIKKYKVRSKIIKINKNDNKIKKLIFNSYFDNINNLKNLTFILRFAKVYKLNKSKLLKTVNLFKGLDFRQQVIYKNKFVTIVNDSKSTSFSSSVNLLKSYKNIFWILGGLAKKGDKLELPSKYYKNIKGYIFGKDKNFFKKKLNNKITSRSYSNLESILKKIAKEIKLNKNKHSHILFSPSAASFDKFKNFEDRGHYFNYLIKKIKFIKKVNA